MTTRCPKCNQRLESFAVNCEGCGWSLVENGETGPPVEQARTGVRLYEKNYEQAMRFLESGELEKAIEIVDTAISLASTSNQRGESTALRGYLKLKQKDSIGAEEDCTQALNFGWRDHRVYAWRAAARGQQNKWPLALDDLYQASTRTAADARRYANFQLDYLQRANEWYQVQLDQAPKNAQLWFGRGWVRLRCGDLDGSAGDLNRALDINPSLHQASLGLALAALEQRDYRSCAELASRATCSEDLEIRRQALVCRARANYFHGRKAEARSDLAMLGQMAGRDPNCLLEHAALRGELGDVTLALGDLRLILAEHPDLGAAWRLKGRLYARLENHRTAIARFGEALRLNPNDPLLLVELGQSYAAIGKTAEAMQAFSHALQMDSQLADAWVGQARMHLAAQDFDQALSAIEQGIALDDHRAESYGVRGQIRFGLCEFRESVEDFSRAVDLAKCRSVRADLYYRRGTAFHEQGDLDHALADFVAASQLQPDQVGTWVWRAAVHSRLQKWNETVADLQQVMKFRSDQARSYLTLARPVAQRCVEYFGRRIQRSDKPSVELHRNRGLAHEFLGNSFQAIEDYRIVLEQERAEPFVTLRFARLLQQLGQHQTAIEYLSRLVRRDRTNHAARYARAISYVANGEIDRGLSDIIKAIKIAPDVARYRLLRGEIRQRRGDLERARQEFNRAIWLDSNDPAAWKMRAGVLLQGGRPELAIQDLSRAIDLAGEPLDLLCTRGRAWLKTGNAVAALADFEKCIRQDPGLLPAVVGRAMAMSLQSRQQEALIWLTKSLHRFGEPHEVARILLTRGKIYYRMGSSSCAIADFSSVLSLTSGDTSAERVGRFARALACIQHGQFDAAKKDLKKVLALVPDDTGATRVNDWLDDRTKKPPTDLHVPAKLVRKDRPRVLQEGVPVSNGHDPWKAQPPFDTWVVRNQDDNEYGPVPKSMLDKWVEQGRISPDMKLLRGDWPRWKRASKIYTNLQENAQRN